MKSFFLSNSKLGMLPLTFARPEDYDLIEPRDKVDILGLVNIAPGQPLTMVVTNETSGKRIEIELRFFFFFYFIFCYPFYFIFLLFCFVLKKN